MNSPKQHLLDGLQRLANLLMVGHGAALLLIFNASIENVGVELRLMAWVFAIGLAAAFWMAYLCVGVGAIDARIDKGGLSDDEFKEAFERGWKGDGQLLFLFFVSCGAFLFGLLAAISVLGRG